MYKLIKHILLAVTFTLLIGCSTNSSLDKVEPTQNSSTNTTYQKIINAINSKNLDLADNSYIDLKTESSNNHLIENAATNLAITHIAKHENILANFYIQEALQKNPSSSVLRYMLIKNQFLAAAKNSYETSYMQKALQALKTNRQLINSYDYGLLADSMVTRVGLTIALNNQETSNLYKRLNKQSAAEFYKEKSQILGINSNDITRP
jgi:outer membrane protein assembly factor BamD (BamD/ComL family)